ncbi:hypothetical protein DCS_03206 [Drechmeria coniospora]|uniref:Uncharacterized protein n=1 Tax=Drechmeria coniospora TaxID=98403 RepID=A0A151GYA4_DRECN|nr:hypothetical protein DCS_03206 [Drechmeria coniospora]KYK62061.1 hypothetical protein DCS_03206 [Drechmeria coniospora]ODA81299.1 hypothetical protein RJ55_04264 [Drechmeria coniospora]
MHYSSVSLGVALAAGLANAAPTPGMYQVDPSTLYSTPYNEGKMTWQEYWRTHPYKRSDDITSVSEKRSTRDVTKDDGEIVWNNDSPSMVKRSAEVPNVVIDWKDGSAVDKRNTMPAVGDSSFVFEKRSAEVPKVVIDWKDEGSAMDKRNTMPAVGDSSFVFEKRSAEVPKVVIDWKDGGAVDKRNTMPAVGDSSFVFEKRAQFWGEGSQGGAAQAEEK